MKLSKIIKKILREQEEIEPIGGETKSPNEFAYFDFKSWAYEFGTKELFRVEKFKASNGIEYTLEEATEMGAGPMFDVLTQIWELWASDNEQFGRIKDENVQEFGKALYNMMKDDGRGFFFKGDEMGAKVGDDAEYLKQRFGVEMNESLKNIKKILKEQNWEPWGGAVNPNYPPWDGSYLNNVAYFESCDETIDFVFTLDGNDYELVISSGGGSSYWDQDGDGEVDPPPSGYTNATSPSSSLPLNGILLSLLIEYMMGNSSILNDYNTVNGPMGDLALGNITQDYIQVNNAGELFSYVYPNLLGSLNISEEGIATIDSNAFNISPLIQIALPDFGSSVQFTTVGELQSMINRCLPNIDICDNVPTGCCEKCQNPNMLPNDPCYPYCECCDDPVSPILSYKCNAVIGQCMEIQGNVGPFSSLEECEESTVCGEQEESDCNLFNSQPQQDQDLVCAACGNGGSFEAEFLGTTITITLPPTLMDSCSCCPQGMPPIPNIDPNKAKMIISKMEKLLKGKPKRDPQVKRMQKLANIKPRK